MIFCVCVRACVCNVRCRSLVFTCIISTFVIIGGCVGIALYDYLSHYYEHLQNIKDEIATARMFTIECSQCGTSCTSRMLSDCKMAYELLLIASNSEIEIKASERAWQSVTNHIVMWRWCSETPHCYVRIMDVMKSASDWGGIVLVLYAMMIIAVCICFCGPVLCILGSMFIKSSRHKELKSQMQENTLENVLKLQ